MLYGLYPLPQQHNRTRTKEKVIPITSSKGVDLGHTSQDRRLQTCHTLGLAVAMLWPCNAPSFSVSAPCFLTTYILIGHIPVRPLAIGHHLPHDYSIAPYITGRCEFSVLNCLRCCPPYWDFPTLQEKTEGMVTERARVVEKDECPKYLPPICW